MVANSSLRVDVFSVFPEIVDSALASSVIGRARSNGLLDVRLHDPRDHTTDKHRSVDDTPFGGGAGMVMRPEPLVASIRAANPPRPLYALSASGERFDQELAGSLATGGGFSLLCGRYEGIDQRVLDSEVDGEISIGDYVLAGGEVAAAVIIEAVGRLVPGVLGNEESIVEESFASGLLEYPHYTRPAEFEGVEVPDVLRSGDHGKVERWRLAQAIHRTTQRRPDLITSRGGLTDAEQKAYAEFFGDA
ncbi:MAG: tRNA (guanosine(37)-N1)-methyltransferase TrmD [Acidimicrobiales bacterium]|nr:tRNA (guanosine(37)-N1)-methyltransferase TrmD [Acidimicrobiales bacterium]RZV42032.1 MAG: tRNA (guanosine(37)-N1)-methyltransferase TrmD [Acidimicrobiales bacterium]